MFAEIHSMMAFCALQLQIDLKESVQPVQETCPPVDDECTIVKRVSET